MLILSRKPNERIKIGGNIWITVVRLGRGQVRLGIEAPPNTNIVREELVQPETILEVEVEDE